MARGKLALEGRRIGEQPGRRVRARRTLERRPQPLGWRLHRGITYLDPTLGIDLSAVGGFTVNGENRATEYRTGNELHLDLSATKFLTKELSVGVIASHYEQVTGDSGEGARLGPLKGRVTAVGGTVGYTFAVGQIPVTTRVKVLREVEVESRFQGTIGWLQVSLPLWVAPTAASSPAVTAKF